MSRRVVSLLVLVAFASNMALPVSAQVSDADVKAGIAQVEDGDLENAVLTLSAAIQRLSGQKGGEKFLATAHLYLAMAHLGLSRIETAKAEVREALRHNRDMALDAKKFPPMLVKMYEEAKQDGLNKPTKKKGGSGVLIAGLGLAAVGGGIAVAAGGSSGLGSGQNKTPGIGVTIQVSNGGGGITGITPLTFTSTTTTATSATYNWNFGDGTTATGESVQHVFSAEGVFQVSLTVTGSEGTGTATTSVSSKTLTGRWSNSALPCPAGDFCIIFDIVQQGNSLQGTWTTSYSDGGGNSGAIVNGGLTAPNLITFTQDKECRRVFTGSVSNNIDTMTGSSSVLNYGCSDEGTRSYRRQ
jgi:hypothetical protein